MASNPTFRFEGEEDDVPLPKKRPAPQMVREDDLKRRAKELQRELGNPEAALQAHLSRYKSESVETQEFSAAERLQRDGTYPCKEFIPDTVLTQPSEKEHHLIRKLAMTYFSVSENEVSSVQHISEVLGSGEKVFFAGAFTRPPQWVLTGALEEIQNGHDLHFPNKPGNLYRIRLRNGGFHWMSHSVVDPLIPLGHSVFTKRSKDSFDPHHYHPELVPFKPQSGFQELVGRNTELSSFAGHVLKEIRQQYGNDVSLSIVQVGVPGQSGPVIQVQFTRDPSRAPVYLSAQQLAAHEVSPELFQTLMRIQKSAENTSTPETTSEGVRGKIKKLFGGMFGNS